MRATGDLPGNQMKIATLQAKLHAGIFDPDGVKWTGLGEFLEEQREAGAAVTGT